MSADDTVTIQAPPAGSYRIDPENSTVHFSGRHLFGLGGVQATFTVRTGEVTVADPVEGSTLNVTVDAASFRSDKTRRDTHVASPALLDTATYPDITFSSRAVRREGSGWVVEGAVTAHGSTVPTELTINKITPEGTGLRVHAAAQHLDRYAFGVTKVKGMAGRYLDLELDALVVPA